MFMIAASLMAGCSEDDPDFLGIWETDVPELGITLTYKADLEGQCLVYPTTACNYTADVRTHVFTLIEPLDVSCGPDLKGIYDYEISGEDKDVLEFFELTEECTSLGAMDPELEGISRAFLVERVWYKISDLPVEPPLHEFLSSF